MQAAIEGTVKLVLVSLLVAAAGAAWLLPRARLVAARAIGDRLLSATLVVGAVGSAAGLAILLAWPARAIEWHLWEASIMPLTLLYVYWIVVMRRARTTEVLDERQDADLTRAGALTWAFSIPAMLLVYVLPNGTLLDGGRWFPCYLLVNVLVFSVIALVVRR